MFSTPPNGPENKQDICYEPYLVHSSIQWNLVVQWNAIEYSRKSFNNGLNWIWGGYPEVKIKGPVVHSTSPDHSSLYDV